MITFFTVPKPFVGKTAMLQENALASLRAIAPTVEILVLGDEEGAADAAAQVGARHIANVERNDHGTPRVDSVFAVARAHARHPILCYVNADILLPPTIAYAAQSASRRAGSFLVVGECWNTVVDERLGDGIPWEALRRGARRRGADALDYFVFAGDVYGSLPPFALGRTVWDNWLVWSARDSGALVVDATGVVVALHQDHDYTHQGSLGKIRGGAEATANRELAGSDRRRLYSRLDATHRLTRFGLVPNPLAIGHAGELARRAYAKAGYVLGTRA